jgi:hypothetical protein
MYGHWFCDVLSKACIKGDVAEGFSEIHCFAGTLF